MAANHYKGNLKKSDDGSYAGFIKDDWGWVINLRAVVIEREGVKYFQLDGDLGEVPDSLKIPGLDTAAD